MKHFIHAAVPFALFYLLDAWVLELQLKQYAALVIFQVVMYVYTYSRGFQFGFCEGIDMTLDGLKKYFASTKPTKE